MAAPTDIADSQAQSRPSSPAVPGPQADPPPAGTGVVWIVRHAVVCCLLTAFAVGSGYGRIVADTKLDLVVNPGGFLQRALTLWDPNGAAGQLQNQAYGYLFPIGPFYATAHWLGVPGWVTQRLWWALLLCVAYCGAVGLARRLAIGTPASRMVAGVAFATSPHVLTVLGPVSAEALPLAFSAWALIPLVEASRGASIRRCAAGSGVAVLCMGGANAALTLAAVLPAVLWLLTRRLSWRSVRLGVAWVGCVGLACAWWVLPLFLLGRYSPPFLDYIESASTTTRTTTLIETLRGTSDWIAYLPDSGSTAGQLLLTTPTLVALTTLVAAAGIFGLARMRSEARSWALLCLAVGVVLVTLGHLGSVEGLFSQDVRGWLDGGLAPIRNVHKFDVVIRLPLVLGMAALVDAIPTSRPRLEKEVITGMVVTALAFAVVGAASPLVAMRMAPSGSFTSVPEYWTQAATWLRAQGSAGRTLLLPGSRFGIFDWGVTKDEPIQPLAGTPWDVRNAIPLSPAGHIRWLDDIERNVARGEGGTILANDLRSAGVQYVLVRNDLDYGLSGSSDPIAVHQALGRVPGLRRVATFGPATIVGGTPAMTYDSHRKTSFPAVEIFSVGGGADPRLTLTDAASVIGLAGGPEAAGFNGLVPTVSPGALRELLPPSAGHVVLTDTPRRREANFGGGPASTSQTLSLDDPLRIDKPQRDYSAMGSEVVAQILGARSVTASSSAADANSLYGADPATMPFSAVDGDTRTAWRPNPGTALDKQWLQIDLGASHVLQGTTVVLPQNSGVSALIASVDGSSTVSTAVTGDGPILLGLPHGRGRSLRIALRGQDSASAGIAEIHIPGVSISRTLIVPPLVGSRAPTQILFSATGQTPGCLFLGDRPMCAADRASLGEDAAGLDRTLTISGVGDYRPRLYVTPRGGSALMRVLADVLHPTVTATASSTAVNEVADSAVAAVDGDLGSAWIADPADPDPTIRLTWTGIQTVRSIKLVLDGQAPATRATSVVVETPQGHREAPVGPDGTVSFPPLRVRTVLIHLRAGSLAANYDPVRHAYARLGVGVSEILIPGVHGLTGSSQPAVALATPVDLTCGRGPDLIVDGVRTRTRVETTVAELSRQEMVEAHPCGPMALRLGVGSHRVQVPSSALWTPGRLEMTMTVTDSAAGTAPFIVRQWGSTSRSVAVGPRSVATLLTVHENENAGWVATMAGHRLAAVTVDGWQQGYIVPAGAGGLIALSYEPQRWMAVGLSVGGVGLVALFGLSFGPLGRWRGRRHAPIHAGRAPWPVLGGILVLAAAGSTTGLVIAGVLLGARALLTRLAMADRLALGGPLALLTAGTALASHPALSNDYVGDSWPVQVLCLCALAVVLFSPLPRGPDERVAARGLDDGLGGGLVESTAAPPSGS